MPPWKVVYSFHGEGGNKWNEVYGLDQADLTSAIGVNDLSLINKRLAFLDNQNVLGTVRVSDINATRVATHRTFNLAGKVGSGALPDPGSGPAPTGSSALYEIPCSSRRTRLLWVRGFPFNWSDVDDVSGIDFVDPRLTKAVQAWVDALVEGQFGVIRMPTAARTPANYPEITTITPLTRSSVTLTLGPVPLINVPGDEWVISGTSLRDWPGLRGTWEAGGLSAGAVVYIAYRTPSYYPLGQAVVGALGTAHRVGARLLDRYVTTSKTAFVRLATHRTRNAFFNSRGRRSAGLRRRSP